MKGTARVKTSRKIRRLKASAEDGGQDQRLVQTGSIYKVLKKRVTLRLDADVVAWFKKQGRGYQTRINRALRKMMREQKSKSEE